MGELPVPGDLDDLIEREWERLAAPGATLNGPARVGVAAVARGERGATTTAERVALVIHDEPASITRPWFDGVIADGLSVHGYVEVLGIVARLRALDTFTFGVGRALRPLPEPVDGRPTGVVDDSAEPDGSWLPTVGPAWPPTILSSLPDETEAMLDVHGALYLAPDHRREGATMGNLAAERDGLDRLQMEYVAARTSLINDCFFWLYAHAAVLRESADHQGRTVDLGGVGSLTVDSGVGADDELAALTEAVVLRDEYERAVAVERAVAAIGESATVRAIAVAGNFEMMNRLLDAAGVGPPPAMHAVGDDIGVPLPARFH